MFPAFLKLEYGCGSLGCYKIESLWEGEKWFEFTQKTISQLKFSIAAAYSLGASMTLMPVLEGTQHDVDLIVFRKKLVVAFVYDAGRTRPGYFFETANVMPSCLAPDQQAQLVSCAHQCVVGVGLDNLVANVELKMTPTGPKLIEINARMARLQRRDWILEVYGSLQMRNHGQLWNLSHTASTPQSSVHHDGDHVCSFLAPRHFCKARF